MKEIPQYFIQPLDEAINRYKKIRRDASFFFVTDTHYRDCAHVATPLIKAFAAKTDVRKLFSGGDYAFAFGPKEECIADTEKSLDYLSEVKPEIDFFSARGNHDITIKFSREENAGYTYPKDFTNKLILSKNSPVTAIMPGEACFYVDYPEEKTRYVVVNTSDTQSDDCNKFWGVHYSITRPQLEWIAKNAFNLEDKPDWSVIVFGHIPCSETIDPVGAPPLKPLNTLLAAFKNRRACKYGNFENAKGDLVAYICGHNHADKSTTEDGVLHISTGSEAYYHDDIWQRVLGTESETIIDVFALDKKERKLYAVRIGAGKDRVFDY
jgi:predicted phosphodiesterase